jgi:baculoviral IAP repeat-containing protein 7/8
MSLSTLRRGYRTARDVLHLKSEQGRLDTFDSWTNSAITPQDLAATGFFHTGESDIVQCVFCWIQSHRWVPGDNAAQEHRRQFPLCPFLIGLPVGNIPIPVGSLPKKRKLSIKTQGNPMNPNHVSLCSRLNSFTKFSGKTTNRKVTKKHQQYAEIGFYKAESNLVFCFYCGMLADPMGIGKSLEEIQSEHSKRDCAFHHFSSERAVATSSSSSTSLDQLCKICMDKKLEIVFLPCSHFVSCSQCCTSMRECGVCREPIDELLKLYV